MKRITRRRGLLSLLGAATATFVCAAAIAPVQTADGPEAAQSNAPTEAFGSDGATPAGTQSDDSRPDGKADDARSDDVVKSADETTVTIGGIRVGVDPKTGELRPLTAAESARLAREMSRLFKPRELTRKQNPDGSLSAVVAPNVLRFSVARVDADGTAAIGCAPGEEAAVDFMTGTPSTAKPQPEEK